jgi:hypothetical protein
MRSFHRGTLRAAAPEAARRAVLFRWKTIGTTPFRAPPPPLRAPDTHETWRAAWEHLCARAAAKKRARALSAPPEDVARR